MEIWPSSKWPGTLKFWGICGIYAEDGCTVHDACTHHRVMTNHQNGELDEDSFDEMERGSAARCVFAFLRRGCGTQSQLQRR